MKFNQQSHDIDTDVRTLHTSIGFLGQHVTLHTEDHLRRNMSNFLIVPFLADH